MPVTRAPKLIICAGLYSSGSTWVFNGVKALWDKSGAAVPLASGYFDNLPSDWLEHKLRLGSQVVIKSHRPNDVIVDAAMAGAPVILTVRDPRDAAASLMARFEYDAERAISLVFLSAVRLMRLLNASSLLLLRYDDGFIASKGTIRKIASFLGIEADPRTIDAIESELAFDSVRSLIRAKFGSEPISGIEARETVDQETQWHPRHLGDGRIRKFEEILAPGDIERLKWAAPGFWERFGYAI